MYIDTSGVTELYTVSEREASLTLGAGINLTRAIQVFKRLAQTISGYHHLDNLAEHWSVVANVAVRNVSTL